MRPARRRPRAPSDPSEQPRFGRVWIYYGLPTAAWGFFGLLLGQWFLLVGFFVTFLGLFHLWKFSRIFRRLLRVQAYVNTVACGRWLVPAAANEVLSGIACKNGASP